MTREFEAGKIIHIEDFDPNDVARYLPSWQYSPRRETVKEPLSVIDAEGQELFKVDAIIHSELKEVHLGNFTAFEMTPELVNQIFGKESGEIAHWHFAKRLRGDRHVYIDVSPQKHHIFTWWGRKGAPIIDFGVDIESVIYEEGSFSFRGPAAANYRISDQGRYHFLQYGDNPGIEIHLF